jgi:hypothetical protein
VVFELSPPSSGNGPWTLQVLHVFTGGNDGAAPNSVLLFDVHGNLYGTTMSGGNSADCGQGGTGCGVVFELSPPGSASGLWTETVPHSFTGGSDGGNPEMAGLVFDSWGNLFGTTVGGGTANCQWGNFAPGCGVVFELLNPATTTALTCSPNPALLGQSVTCNVVVTAVNGTPTGAVAIRDTSLRCTIPLSGGAGSCNISSFQFGQHSLYAVYSPSGGSGLNGSQSPYFIETICRNATASSLVSSLNPANVGQTIMFTATVSHTTGAPAPVGTVTFKDYGTALGNATLVGNAASFSTSSLIGDVGHSITATYNGDTNYNGSVSNAISQVVNRLPASMGALTCNPNPSTSGSSVTCTGTLTGPGAGATVDFTSGPTHTTVLASTTSGAGGAFSASFPLGIRGTYGITATFWGDATYRAAEASVTHVVK